MSNQEEIVHVKDADFLEEDQPIRGQNFACISFISPEDVIRNKNTYFFNKYLTDFQTRMSDLMTNLEAKYPKDQNSFKGLRDSFPYLLGTPESMDLSTAQDYENYININSEDLEDAYHKENKFQTSVRGVKIRGVYDTLEQAQARAKAIKKFDTIHNIYVSQVGCWCPFNPNPDDVEGQEYAESSLNTLMKSYKENETKKDVEYDARKREMSTRQQTVEQDDVSKLAISTEFGTEETKGP
jgi:hypothetical protein